jgi:CheY-like chemotaxis protein
MRMIRQNPDKKNTPFIILSGIEQDATGETENCLADVYLLKDENLKENLTKTLAEIFD